MESTVTVQHIIEAAGFSEYAVVAGRKGLRRPVRSVLTAETPDVAGVLDPETLVATAGSQMPDDAAWTAWIRDLCEAGAAAVCIQPGRYVERIPQAVLALGDALRLPILQMPSDERPTAFIDRVTRLLYAVESVQPVVFGDNPAFFRSCLAYAGMDANERYAFELGVEANGYALDRPYQVLVYPDGGESDAQREKLFLRTLFFLRDSDPLVFGTQTGEYTLLFYHLPLDGQQGKAVSGWLEHPIVRECAELLMEHNFKLYVSPTLTGIKGIGAFFQSIVTCIAIDRKLTVYAAENPATYRNSLLLRMLSQLLLDEDLCREYVEQTLMIPLREETPRRQKEILWFLKTIFRMNGRIKDIAAHTNTHPNTVHYRIQYIEKVYHSSLKNIRTQMILQLALILRAILYEEK